MRICSKIMKKWAYQPFPFSFFLAGVLGVKLPFFSGGSFAFSVAAAFAFAPASAFALVSRQPLLLHRHQPLL